MPLSATSPLARAPRGTALGAPAAGRVAGQPLTRGPEAVKTKTMRVTLPLCAGSVTVSGGSTMQRASCADALSGRSAREATRIGRELLMLWLFHPHMQSIWAGATRGVERPALVLVEEPPRHNTVWPAPRQHGVVVVLHLKVWPLLARLEQA